MTAENFAFPADEQQRAIDRCAGHRVTFGDADHDIDAGSPRRFAKLVGYWAGNLDGVGEILGHRPPCQRTRRRMDEEWIAGQPGLAERREGCAHRSGLADQPAGFFGGGFAVERNGGGLDRSELEESHD